MSRNRFRFEERPGILPFTGKNGSECYSSGICNRLLLIPSRTIVDKTDSDIQECSLNMTTLSKRAFHLEIEVPF